MVRGAPFALVSNHGLVDTNLAAVLRNAAQERGSSGWGRRL